MEIPEAIKRELIATKKSKQTIRTWFQTSDGCSFRTSKIHTITRLPKYLNKRNKSTWGRTDCMFCRGSWGHGNAYGGQSYYVCLECGVGLCINNDVTDGKSCWDMWHSSAEPLKKCMDEYHLEYLNHAKKCLTQRKQIELSEPEEELEGERKRRKTGLAKKSTGRKNQSQSASKAQKKRKRRPSRRRRRTVGDDPDSSDE